MITFLITLLALLSYTVGVRSVLGGAYKPSIYSRFIWFLLSVNSLAGVIALRNGIGTIALAGVQALGSMAMLIAAWRYSVREFGKVEKACTALLALSGIAWVVIRMPIVNVLISLVAHLIGGLPTLARARRRPESEDFLFWLSFAIASVLAFATANKADFRAYVYALYFAAFDGAMTILSARRYVRGMV
jgi:hypothetical protein